MSNLLMVLGNGFSIDIVTKLELSDVINLNNLFAKGEEVIFPKTEQKGFLSRKYSPNLWTLGARPYMKDSESTKLISDVLTCANVYNLSIEKQNRTEQNNNIYISAYNELSSYLRYLFIYYNSLVEDERLANILSKIEILQLISKGIDSGKKIHIVTYNYDVFLERLLMLSNIPFDVYGFTNTGSSVIIYKPHGSISFSFKTKVPESSPYNVQDYINDSISQNSKSFSIIYDLVDDFPIVNAIIPPAGDSSRLNLGWIKEIRQGIEETISYSTSDDNVTIFGLSYWHVDRNEIDIILTKLNSKVDIVFVNPDPPSSIDAVLSSLFEKYVHYTSSKILIGR